VTRKRLALLAAGLAGVAIVHRRSRRLRGRVELFYEDGSVVALTDDEAKPLLDVARSIL
jgi:hypothetical protein